jgi:hypothetical protein
MLYYLYKKTHKKTGLQYLGKTIQDPFKYKGSGKRWGYHIKKHGYDVDTVILLETTNEQELITAGLYYSKLWNVVNSNEWANLKPEAGDGGGMPEASRKQFAEKMKGHPNWLKAQPESAKQLIRAAQKELVAKLTPEELTARMKNSCCHPDSYTPERSKKISDALTGTVRTNESKKKQSNSRKELAKNMTIEERKQFFGGHNKGKPWSEARRVAHKKKEKVS